MRFKINLEGKTALVTGAARGIRRASALMLAGEGGRVVIATRDAEGTERVASEIEGLGGTALPVRTDVTSAHSIKEAVEAAERAFGEVDVLVNNVGAPFGDKVINTSEEDFHNTMDLCLKSVFLCSKQVLPGMMERGWGRIINIASVAGEVTSVSGRLLIRRPRRECWLSPATVQKKWPGTG